MLLLLLLLSLLLLGWWLLVVSLLSLMSLMLLLLLLLLLLLMLLLLLLLLLPFWTTQAPYRLPPTFLLLGLNVLPTRSTRILRSSETGYPPCFAKKTGGNVNRLCDLHLRRVLGLVKRTCFGTKQIGSTLDRYLCFRPSRFFFYSVAFTRITAEAAFLAGGMVSGWGFNASRIDNGFAAKRCGLAAFPHFFLFFLPLKRSQGRRLFQVQRCPERVRHDDAKAGQHIPKGVYLLNFFVNDNKQKRHHNCITKITS